MDQPGTSTDNTSPSRRQFLKSTSAAVGASALSSLVLASPVHAAGKDTVKIGLIGCGERGTGAAIQAMNAHPSVKLIAVADVFEDHVQSSLKRMKKARPDQVAVDKDHAFAGFDGYRKVIDSGIDAVLIACASRFHPEYLMAGVQKGIHVFVEKPHAIDPPGVKVVLEASELAKKKKVCVVSGLHRRYMPSIQQTIERIHDGAIGDIIAMEVSFMRAPYRIIPRQPQWSEIEWQFRTWYHFAWLSGDDLPQSLVHTVDVSTWALGEEPPVSAHALGGRSASIAHKFGDVFDHSSVVYEYANGARTYGMVRTQYGCHGEVNAKIFGSKGIASEGRIVGENNWTFPGRRQSGHQLEQIAFINAIREGKIINNGSYMARSTLVGIMGQMASYSGKKLTWKEVESSTFKFSPTTGTVDFTTDPPVKADENGIYPVPMPGKTKLA